MSTIKDVARRTGLSLSTISKYLNGGNVREENRLAIDAAIEELDYSVNVFARSLKANRSMTIGVLLPTISSPFFGRVVAAMEPVLRRSGYECFVCSYDFDREQELKKLEFLARYHVDGIVYVPENVTAGEVRARVGIGVHVGQRMAEHQVHVEEQIALPADGRHEVRPEADIGHKNGEILLTWTLQAS